jgi:hypothetical protein
LCETPRCSARRVAAMPDTTDRREPRMQQQMRAFHRRTEREPIKNSKHAQA